jgi:hypothetical protein
MKKEDFESLCRGMEEARRFLATNGKGFVKRTLPSGAVVYSPQEGTRD